MVSGHRKPADGFSRPDTGLSGNPGTARLQPGLLRVLCVLRGMKHYVSLTVHSLKMECAQEVRKTVNCRTRSGQASRNANGPGKDLKNPKDRPEICGETRLLCEDSTAARCAARKEARYDDTSAQFRLGGGIHRTRGLVRMFEQEPRRGVAVAKNFRAQAVSRNRPVRFRLPLFARRAGHSARRRLY